MTILFGICVVVILLYFISFFVFRESFNASRQFDGPPALPILGNAYVFLFQKGSKGIFDTFWELSQKYDRFFRMWFAGKFVLVIKEYREFEVILSHNSQIDKGDVYQFLLPWIGYGLLTSKGQKWRSRRKILTPAFHFKILESFIETFNRNGYIMCDQLEEHVDKEPIDIYKYIKMMALDNICETAMGINMNIQTSIETTYAKAVKDMCFVVNKRAFTIWMWADIVFKLSKYGRIQQNALNILHKTTNGVIQERKRELAIRSKLMTKQEDADDDNDSCLYSKKRLAFLDLLLESADAHELSDEDIREEVETFMFEGHDTITSGLSFAIRALADNPTVQDKVYEEQMEIFGHSDRPATLTDLQEMKYLDMTLKEAQRLFPSVPIIARELNDTLVLPEGQVLPKSTQISLFIYALHRDPKVWARPDHFDPENFSLEAIQKRNPFAYVPFSAGPRNCIGQKFALLEMKATLSKIVRKFKILASPYEEHQLQLAAELVLMSMNGIHIKLERRK